VPVPNFGVTAANAGERAWASRKRSMIVKEAAVTACRRNRALLAERRAGSEQRRKAATWRVGRTSDYWAAIATDAAAMAMGASRISDHPKMPLICPTVSNCFAPCQQPPATLHGVVSDILGARTGCAR
jgi:hypothetical protein